GAVFIAAAFISRRRPAWIARLGIADEWLQAALWLAAALVALPMFVAVLRKLQALGLLVAETRISDSGNPERTAAVRGTVAQGIPLAGMAAMALYVLLLSSALLPPVKILFVLIALLVLLSWVFWRTLIKLYARAQVAIEETLTQPPDQSDHEHNRPLVPM